MILRTWEDVDHPSVVAGQARCAQCRGPVTVEEVEPKDGAFLSLCCDAVVFLPNRDTPSLVEAHGPAFAEFVPVPSALLAMSALSATARLVAIALLDYRDLVEIYPSQDTLARQCGLSERTVRTALANLERAGLIVRTRRNDYRGQRTSDRVDLAPLLAELNRLATESAVRPTGRNARLDDAEGDPLPATSVVPTGNIRQGQATDLAGDLEVEDLDLDLEDLDGRRRSRADGELEERDDFLGWLDSKAEAAER